jgi:proteasome accessory factor A
VENRIFGTECEYALLYSSDAKPTTRLLSGEALLDHMKSLTPFLVSSLRPQGYAVAGEFLGNGGRFYIDRGGHPEYATPECRTLKDLVAYEIAGDRILQDLVAGARKLMAEQGHIGKLRVFKNNVDSFGTTYGGHENYLVTPGAMESISSLIPFLVTRQIFAGSGKALSRQSAGESRYQLTQRADFVDRVCSDRTSEVRGIINIRKREIPREGQNRRLHIIVGDSNMSEYAIWLKIGTTSLILRLLEEGALEDMPALSSPVKALKDVSNSLRSPVSLENRSGTYNALDVQRQYLDRVQRFCDRNGASREDREVLDQWSVTLDGLEKLVISEPIGTLEEDPCNVRSRLDWVLKLWLINRVQRENTIGWDHRKSRLTDLIYHDLDPETGLFQQCLKLHLVERILDDETIDKARYNPPSDTRASIRGMIVQQSEGKNVEVTIDNWEQVKIAANPMKPGSEHPFRRLQRMSNRLDIKLLDPFSAQDNTVKGQVEAFIENWG